MSSFKKKAVGLILSSLVFLTACGGENHASDETSPQVLNLANSEKNLFQIKLEWLGEPKAGNHLNLVQVIVLDRGGQTPPDGTAIELKSFHVLMPSMGHGSPEDQLKIASHEEWNHFLVSGVKFSMAGAEGSWIAKLEVVYDDSKDAVTVSLPRIP